MRHLAHTTAFTFCRFLSLATVLAMVSSGCNQGSSPETASEEVGDLFPEELTAFKPYEKNPVFTGTAQDTWDEVIRERGYILKEEDGYHMWYTGYRKDNSDQDLALGYATSPDGLVWTRYPGNPIYKQNWVEDMMVLKHDSLYYMFAEGRDDIAHLLTSRDKVNWIDRGNLQIRQANGEPLSAGPYGTPTVWKEGNTWYLFYERNDEGIWLATSNDLTVWTNVQDQPVLEKGPEKYDLHGVAVNQIIRHGDYYYAYYHGTPTEDWSEWNTNIAVSTDLLHWKKNPANPILEENKSSGILVHDVKQYRLYTMHEEVNVHFPKGEHARASERP